MTDPRTLLFLHIPKTAGTTLFKIAQRHYPAASICFLGRGGMRESIEWFKNLPEAERAAFRCVKGHMPFGLHRYLPQPSTYITVLREPIDRAVSHYYFVKNNPQHRLYHTLTSRNMSLEEYISSGISSELDNGQVRLISGIEAVDSVFGHEPVSPEVLEVAKVNLQQHFLVVGLSEQFDESLLLFSRLLGWNELYYQKSNVTQGRPAVQAISPQARRIVEKYNQLDLELYELAQTLLAEKLREHGIGRKEVLVFQAANQMHGQAARLQGTGRRFKRAAQRVLGHG